MFKNNQEIQNRLDKIFSKIAKFDLDDGFDLALSIYEEEVLAETLPRSSSIHNSIEFALTLLSNNETSRIFWKSYAQTYLVSSSNFYTDLSIRDIKSISSILMKESKSNKNLKETLGRFERFIGTNGLLKNFSKNFIEFNPTLVINKIGALATLNDSDQMLEHVIFHGKSMLCKIIFSVYGLKVVGGRGVDEYLSSRSIAKLDIDYLVKRNLIKDVDQEYKENLETLFNDRSYDFNSAHREYIHSFVRTKELEDKISIESYGFEDYEDDLEMNTGFNDILAFNVGDLKFHVDYEQNPYWYADIIQGTARHAINTLRKTVKYKYDLFHNSDKETISIEGLTMLAGLSNQDSVKNILNKSKSKLKKRAIENRGKGPDGYFKIYKAVEIESKSAIGWLRDNKRRYKIYELIDEKPAQNIDYDYVYKEINRAKEKIEKSKKKSKPFSDNDTFVRTEKEIFGRVHKDNKKRWEWIGKKGRTFKELNAKNSTYRKNIRRQTYKKHTSPITQDILYDLNSGYIKQIK
tara:strand:+ start:1378 stop:2937 length:1560 start_codon:yes stop_codon:yes gene_type:complete